jgi:hypothetical protein
VAVESSFSSHKAFFFFFFEMGPVSSAAIGVGILVLSLSLLARCTHENPTTTRANAKKATVDVVVPYDLPVSIPFFFVKWPHPAYI